MISLKMGCHTTLEMGDAIHIFSPCKDTLDQIVAKATIFSSSNVSDRREG